MDALKKISVPFPVSAAAGALLAIALLLAPTTSRAADLGLLVGGELGAGCLFGEGSDDYSPNVGVSLSLGPSFGDYLAVPLVFQLQTLDVDVAEFVEDEGGQILIMAISPEIDPLGSVDWLKVPVGPYLGFAEISTKAAYDGTSSTAIAKGFYLGGRLGLYFRLGRTGLWAGASITVARFYHREECVSTGSDNTSCDNDPVQTDEGYYSVSTGLRWWFE